MKKILIFIGILLLCFSLAGCVNAGNSTELKQEGQEEVQKNDEEVIKNVVENFGSRLQLVSLLGPKDAVEKSIIENYSDFITPALLELWVNNPLNAALGRVLSSPWPDRIEIQSIDKISQDVYEVKGEIIEITSVEKEKGGYNVKRPIALIVKKVHDRWLIDGTTLGEYDGENLYKNNEYGFIFRLLPSWQGYTIINDTWEGFALGDVQNNKISEAGPMIIIRHPEWTTDNPRQDIPLMVFTHEQWEGLQKEEFHIGAAPIGPKELGRNSKYVIALPARYNFAFPTGFEEVEEMLESNSLQVNEIFFE
ncbi:MAG: hypothetical protein ACOYJ1_16245 [Peptococcales bacterium]|jgi:hypothetical protein